MLNINLYIYMISKNKDIRDLPINEWNRELTYHNFQFWEHFTDHLQMIIAWLIVGVFLTNLAWTSIMREKIRIDYELEEGDYLVVSHNNKSWIVTNPSTLIQWLDIYFVALFDGKKQKTYNKQDKRRIRIISRITFTIFILAIIWGIIMLMSSLARDINPFNYLSRWLHNIYKDLYNQP